VVKLADVGRVDFGYFVRPAEEALAGEARVEPCLGYVVRLGGSVLLLDSGMGAHPGVDAHYRPVRRPLAAALTEVGLHLEEVGSLVNCHLHFDHCGGNPLLAGRPTFVQTTELEEARSREHYTLPELIDFDGARYEKLDGEVEIAPDVWIVPTPGHTRGHQSLVIRCIDGTVVLAGQAHDDASSFGADQLAWRARNEEQLDGPLPNTSAWLERLMAFDPRRVLFAHDRSVWEP
jgi:N-acyl homoserine lactone hydrolase